MKKCEVIEQFTLNDFDELSHLVRADETKNEKGKLYIGDTFTCTDEMSEYLTGKNAKNKVVVKVLETFEMPKLKEEVKLNELGNPIGTREIKSKEEKPKKTAKKKTSKK